MDLPEAALQQLQAFIQACKVQPQILHKPQLAFFKDYLVSLGAKLPEPPKQPQQGGCCGEQQECKKPRSPSPTPPEPPMDEDSAESDLELDDTGVVAGEEDAPLEMGDPDQDVSEDAEDAAQAKKRAAMEASGDEAVQLWTEAIKLNPRIALYFAKRAQLLVRLGKPNQAIRDCDRAIEMNSDSAGPYKARGRAHRLLGNWAQAKADLDQGQKLDYDDDTAMFLKEQVLPNAKKVAEHKRKYERKAEERELRERRERVRRAQEARKKAQEEAEAAAGPGGMPGGFPGGMPGGGMPGGMPFNMGGGAGGGPDLSALFSDPEVMAAMQDPEVMQAFSDVSQNPANMAKYENNPKIKRVIEKLSGKFGGMGGGPPPGPDMGPGCGGPPPPTGPSMSSFNDLD